MPLFLMLTRVSAQALNQPIQRPGHREGVCYFNGTQYPIGTYVLGGSEVLQCSGRGVWVNKGEKRPA